MNVTLVIERMFAFIKKALGNGFASREPKTIGDKGWSAPFTEQNAITSLKTTGYYQCAMNLFALKLNEDSGSSINWRNVKYLADYYWKAASTMAQPGSFEVNHFPHLIHSVVNDVSAIEEPWAWGVFEKLMGQEITLAFCYALCCAIERKETMEPWETAALTAQVKFHLLADQIGRVTRRMQFTENVSADFKALGFSALQEAEQIKYVITVLQSRKPSDDVRVTNSELHDAIKVARANASELVGAPDVSAGTPKPAAANVRMLDLTIKLARVIMKFPEILYKLRYMEQRYGKECLCDSPAKLEKIIQQCGGADCPGLGAAVCEVLDGTAPVWAPVPIILDAACPDTRSIGSRPGRLAGSLRGWWPGVSAGRLRLSGW